LSRKAGLLEFINSGLKTRAFSSQSRKHIWDI
jgi:hypothetical protein